MKRYLILIIVLVASLCMKGQFYTYFYGGYRTGFPALSNINREVYIYNYTRQWLDKKMDFFNQLNGGEIGYGWVFRHFGMYASFQAQWKNNTAYGIEPGTADTGFRVITPMIYGTDLAFQWYPVNSRYIEMGLGGSINLSAFRIPLVYRNSGDKTQSERIPGATGLMPSSTFSLQINFYPIRRLGIMVRPYYQVFYSGGDVSPMFYELQNAGFPYPLIEFPNHFGIAVSLMIADRDRE